MRFLTLFALISSLFFPLSSAEACSVRLGAKLLEGGGKEREGKKRGNSGRLNDSSYSSKSVSRLTKHQLTIGLDLWNYGEEATEVEVVALFLGGNDKPGSRAEVLDSKSERFILPAMKHSDFIISSKVIESEVVLTATTWTSETRGSSGISNSRRETGRHYKGWIMVLRCNWKVMGVEASSQELKSAIGDIRTFEKKYGSTRVEWDTRK